MPKAKEYVTVYVPAELRKGTMHFYVQTPTTGNFREIATIPIDKFYSINDIVVYRQVNSAMIATRLVSHSFDNQMYLQIALDMLLTTFADTGKFPFIVVDPALNEEHHKPYDDRGMWTNWGYQEIVNARTLYNRRALNFERVLIPIRLFKHEYELFVANSVLKDLTA